MAKKRTIDSDTTPSTGVAEDIAESPAACELCGVLASKLTFHHLIPRTCHSNKWFKKTFDREEMHTRGIMLCRPCHKMIHKLLEPKELGRSFNTLDKLRAHPTVESHVQWVQKRARSR